MPNVIQKIAAAIDVINRTDRADLVANWRDVIKRIDSNWLPHGSGFDSGSNVNIGESTARRAVIDTSFHHMDEYGAYDGWTNHRVIVTPEFSGFSVRVTGRDRNGIKDYIADVFNAALSADCAVEYRIA